MLDKILYFLYSFSFWKKNNPIKLFIYSFLSIIFLVVIIYFATIIHGGMVSGHLFQSIFFVLVFIFISINVFYGIKIISNHLTQTIQIQQTLPVTTVSTFSLFGNNETNGNKKKIFNKVITGISWVIFIGVCALSKGLIKVIFHAKNGNNFQSALYATSQKINRQCPTKFDGNIRMDFSETAENTMKYYYTYTNIAFNQINVFEFNNFMRPRLIDYYKHNPDMQAFREHNVKIEYVYRSNDGVEFSTISISPNDF